MKPVIFLRIASVLTLIHAILHTVGGVFGKPEPGTAAMVVKTMQENHFVVFGVTRTYSDFYLGLGLGITIFLTVDAVLFWQMGALAKNHAIPLKPILVVLALGYVAFAAVSCRYFFQGPVIAEVLIAISLGLAILTMKPVEKNTSSSTVIQTTRSAPDHVRY